MDTATVSLIGMFVTAIISIASFVRSGKSDNTKDAERWGAFSKEMEYVRKDLDEIKGLVGQNSRDTKDSIRRVHERIDRHLIEQHNMDVPKR